MSMSFGVLLAALAASSVSGVSMSKLDEPSVRVAMRDLDLANPAHARRLDGRIRVAVNRVCPAPAARGVAAQWQYSDCRKVAMTSARRQIDRAMAAARTGEPVALARK